MNLELKGFFNLYIYIIWVRWYCKLWLFSAVVGCWDKRWISFQMNTTFWLDICIQYSLSKYDICLYGCIFEEQSLTLTLLTFIIVHCTVSICLKAGFPVSIKTLQINIRMILLLHSTFVQSVDCDIICKGWMILLSYFIHISRTTI